jgi:TfoX/Sxy family transcriptional regulator of competence genes
LAYSEVLAARVRRSLTHVKKVEEKKMFGGICFMVNEKMCVTVGKNRLMCRINPETHDEAVSKKGVKTVIMKGRDYKGYVYVDEDSIRSAKNLEYWIRLALNYNKSLKGKTR